MNWFSILEIIGKLIMNIINYLFSTDGRAWAIFFSALVALWGYTSSLRPYIHVYLGFNKITKAELTFNIANRGKVGAKKVEITLKEGDFIYRFDEQTARDGKPYESDEGEDMNLKLPSFHEREVIPPDFHYETFLGRAAGASGNEKFTKPFELIVKYRSSLPFIHRIPFVGQFKETFFLNPKMFLDVVGTDKKEVIELSLELKQGNKITGTAVRKYPN